jgi:hypothetical protein
MPPPAWIVALLVTVRVKADPDGEVTTTHPLEATSRLPIVWVLRSERTAPPFTVRSPVPSPVELVFVPERPPLSTTTNPVGWLLALV